MKIWNILGILLGIALFIYGGYYDSPGGQMFGAVLVLVTIVLVGYDIKKSEE